ncbi:MAG TPA: hypothetical protein VFM71_07315 [Gemmatimonadaceae bacterium]|nr:hypothetical protein [Gemmatimonadaceae bacterium]
MSPVISRLETSPAELLRPLRSEDQDIIPPDALTFLAALGHRFSERMHWLASARAAHAQHLADGTDTLTFPAATADIRDGDWHVAPAPADFGPGKSTLAEPSDRGAMIDALAKGAGLAVADFEDSTSPTWSNVVDSQRLLRLAVRRSLHADPTSSGRQSSPQSTLVVRPRSWQRRERHVLVDDRPMPAPLVDAGLFMFHNAHALRHHRSGPYFSLPRVEGGSEAALWEDVLTFAEEWLDLPRGTARVTMMVESVGAVFELDEVLYALRDRVCGMSIGRWNYLVSFIRTRSHDPRAVLPDRSQLTMTQPALKAYAQRVVQVCHRRGAWTDGFDVRDSGDDDGAPITAEQLLVTPTGSRTEAGLRFHVRVAMRYLEAWLRGRGRVSLYGVREDASAAELSSAQVWQWVRHGATLDDGRRVTRDLVNAIVTEEMRVIAGEVGKAAFVKGRFIEARTLFLSVATAEELPELVTVAGYPKLTEQ